MPIKVGNIGIEHICLGNTEVIKKYIGSELVYQKQSSSELTLVPLGFKYASSIGDYETSNETGTLVVLLQAGHDIGTITGVYTDSDSAFWKSQPFYIGRGNYVAVFGKQKGYPGSNNDYGRNVMTMVFSSPNLSETYSATTTAGYNQDHYGVPRVKTAQSKVGVTTFDIVPRTTKTITKRVYGLAYDVTSITGNNVYRYDEQWNEVVYYAYAMNCSTVAASEATGAMLTASLSIQRKVSTATIQVSANTGTSARLGDVQLTRGGEIRTRHIVLQEGENIRFCRIDGILVEGTSLSDSRMWNYSNLRVIDLSTSGTTYTFSGKDICFFDGIANDIQVTNANNTVITPTTRTEEHGTFAYYNCNSSSGTINVTIL